MIWKYKKGDVLVKKNVSIDAGREFTHLILKRTKHFYEVITLWDVNTGSWDRESLERDYEFSHSINIK